MGEKSCFSFITFLDPYIVISLMDVHNHELGTSTEVVNDLRNEGGYISIFPGPFVYGLVVLYWSYFPVLFLYKEEIGCIG